LSGRQGFASLSPWIGSQDKHIISTQPNKYVYSPASEVTWFPEIQLLQVFTYLCIYVYASSVQLFVFYCRFQNHTVTYELYPYITICIHFVLVIIINSHILFIWFKHFFIVHYNLDWTQSFPVINFCLF